MGQTIAIENIGGGGVIAAQAPAKAVPDGYTLMQGYVATHGTSPATRDLPHDPIRDFTPVGMIGAAPNVLVVNMSLPAKGLNHFLAPLRGSPGRLNYGSAGAGSLNQLAMELFRQTNDVFIVHVP